MVQVYWLEQAEADVPAPHDWLAPGEQARLKGFRFLKRRMDWLLGRWTAKTALAAHLDLPGHAASLAGIEIRQAPSGAPQALIGNQPASVVISLSHRAGQAICAVAPLGAALGCDLEVVEPRNHAFVADYFAPEEQDRVARAPEADRPRVATLIWSAKESALKALETGLRLDTRSVIVSLDEEVKPADVSEDHEGSLPAGNASGGIEWQPCRVRDQAGREFQGWWRRTGHVLRTVVSDPEPDQPIRLSFTPSGPSFARS